MPIVSIIATALGISPLRVIIYSGLVVAAVAGGLTIRQHYINKGYASAIAKVKKQDDKAIGAAQAVERKATVCSNENGYWDVITQACHLDEDAQ